MFNFKVFYYFMHDLCDFFGDLEEFHSSIVKGQDFFQSLGYSSAVTEAFNLKLDQYTDVRLHMFMRYIWKKEQYDICHKICDDEFYVDALWKSINVLKYDSSGFIFKDMNTNRAVIGDLNRTSMLDYKFIPIYNYSDFYLK